MIFWRKIVIFHTKYPKKFRASLRSAQFFKCPPPNLKSWIRPCTDLKETIMGLDQEGYSAYKIAEFLSLNRRTVSYIIKRYRERGTVENLPRSGRKKKTNVMTDRPLLRMVKTNRRQTLGDLTSKFNNSTPCKLS